jgi:ribosome-associated protein
VKFLPPEDELDEQFVRAGGPGGQHVDRSETAVQLRFDVAASAWLSDDAKRRLLQLAGQRADADGIVTIQARTHRSQRRNRDEARRRLADLIERALKTPKRRRKTAPSRAAKKKRLRDKRRRSETKRRRGQPSPDE